MLRKDCSLVMSNNRMKPIASRKKAVVRLRNLDIANCDVYHCVGVTTSQEGGGEQMVNDGAREMSIKLTFPGRRCPTAEDECVGSVWTLHPRSVIDKPI